MLTYIIFAAVIVAIVGYFIIDKNRDGKISKAEIEALEARVERLGGANFRINLDYDELLAKTVNLIEALPVSTFKKINVKLDKVGLKLVRVQDDEGSYYSSLIATGDPAEDTE